jgi:rubrerythrin
MGFLANWVLRRVVKSALVFEASSLETLRNLRERLVDHPLWDSLGHLLEEDEHHWQILGDVAEGRVDAATIEQVVEGHLFPGMADLRPLEGDARRTWGSELERVLADEEQTLIFYGNLGRMSRIPMVRRAFQVLASMEQEHVQILQRLLAAPTGAAATPVVDSAPAGE